jgi:hypothetical protein
LGEAEAIVMTRLENPLMMSVGKRPMERDAGEQLDVERNLGKRELDRNYLQAQRPL